VVAFACIYLAALAGVPWTALRVSWLIPLLWLWQTWTSIRHGPLFAITAGLALAEMLPQVRWMRWLERHGSVTCRIRVPAPAPASGWRSAWKPVLVPGLLVFLTAGLQVAGVRCPVVGAGWARPHDELYPTELLPELRAYERERPRGTPIFNDMLFGGFLIYYTPDLRVFLDDRCELYGDDWLQSCADAFKSHPEQIEQWADQYGFDRALVVPNTMMDDYLAHAPGWTVLRRTSTAVLYRHGRDQDGEE
jgi:hypothetical protein